MENVKAAIEPLVKAGCPETKIVVGIPAYARHRQNPAQVQTYSEIVDAISKVSPDATLKDVAHRSSWKGFHFDSPNNVREKVHYAMDRKMAGVFFWEIGQDKQHADWAPGGILLESAAHQVGSSASTVRSEL